ncbi:MAG: type II toxin-antitoxin system HipA family toxin [Betaproteobacteria bacterium]|nr:type II toxin-antitoxin system HipA family toxin [Betaproteobacteria bacterium]
MAQRELLVFAHLAGGFVPAGRVTLTEERELVASSFVYGLRYLDRPCRFEIDPVSLSLADPERIRGVALFPHNQLTQFGGIRDAAPDAWGRRVIEAQRRVPANSLSEAEYLLGAGSDRVGALDVRDSLESQAQPGSAKIRSLEYLLEAAERIEQGLPVPAGLDEIFGAGPSAGGARPKASVRDETNLLWLAKFPVAGDTFCVAHAECFTLELARRCGLSVPAVKVMDIGGKSVLLIRRFDRYWQTAEVPQEADSRLFETLPGAGREEQRQPFVSGLTLVGCDEMESRLKGYGDLVLAMRRHTHTATLKTDCEELFGRMIFNIFASNDDDHLRNHGFVRDPRLPGWRLSPLYDVVPRPGVASERQLHLQVGSQGKLATLDNALSAFSAFTPQRTTAIAIIRRIWGELRQWKTVFEQLGASGHLLDKLSPAFRCLADICSPELQAEIRRSGDR